ncbi:MULTISPECIES: hypothetical protein [unclassified Blastococcus]
MTQPPDWDLPAPRAATTPFEVRSRQSTLEWSPPAAAGPAAADDAPRAGRGRRAVTRRFTPALASAVVSAAVVWALMTVGPLADRAADAPARDSDKAAPEQVDTGWRPLDVSGGFLVTGDGARYRVVDGICYLQVHLRDPDGFWAANAPIALLPESARPAWNHDFVASRDGVPYSEVGVYDDGRVLMSRPGDGGVGWLTVSASFPVGH